VNYRVKTDGDRAWLEATCAGPIAARHARSMRAVIVAAKHYSTAQTTLALENFLAKARQLCAIECEARAIRRDATTGAEQ
jgi:hypothetical protein